MQPLLVLSWMAGCSTTPEPTLAAFSAPVDAALLIPCQTPSGKTVALGLVRSGRCRDGKPPRDCATWRQILEHPFACQPGAPLLELDPQEAVLFWVEGASPDQLEGAVATRGERWRCDRPGGAPLDGSAQVLRYQDEIAEVDFDMDGFDGALSFTICR